MGPGSWRIGRICLLAEWHKKNPKSCFTSCLRQLVKHDLGAFYVIWPVNKSCLFCSSQDPYVLASTESAGVNNSMQ